MTPLWLRIRSLGSSITKSFQRFPVTMLSSVLLAGLLIWMNETSLADAASQTMIRTNMAVGLFALLSLCIGLANEAYSGSKNYMKQFLYLLGLLLVYGFFRIYLAELTQASMMRYVAIMTFLSISIFFLQRWFKEAFYEAYVMKILNGILTTGIYSGVLYFGVSAIMFTISTLFNVNIASKFYYYSFLIVFFIFAVSVFLSKLPFPEEDHGNFVYPDALRILLIYIVIPLISVYTLILYAYFARILISGEWPQGLVSHLVLWYSTVSVGVIFLLSPVLAENKVGSLFYKWFPKLIIPVLAMMFASINLRISQYGFTENRYLIVLLGIWVTFVMVYYSLIKHKRNILIPVSLAVVILISSFGPMSSFAVAVRSQNQRIESILSEFNMIQEGSIVPNPDLPSSQKQEVSNILGYFDQVHSLDYVSILPEGFKLNNMPAVFGFEFRPRFDFPPSNYFYYYSDIYQQPLKVEGYEYFFLVNPWNEEFRKIDDLRISFSLSRLVVEVYQDSTSLVEIDLTAFIQEVHSISSSPGDGDREKAVPSSRMTFSGENTNVRYSVSFTNVSGYSDMDELPVIENLDFVLLLHLK